MILLFPVGLALMVWGWHARRRCVATDDVRWEPDTQWPAPLVLGIVSCLVSVSVGIYRLISWGMG